MEYIYTTRNTCSTHIKLEIQDKVITKVEFTGGCDGNLKSISKLVEGWAVDEIANKLNGIQCGGRPTSCADQLSKAVMEAYARQMNL